jgi:cytochrome P450
MGNHRDVMKSGFQRVLVIVLEYMDYFTYVVLCVKDTTRSTTRTRTGTEKNVKHKSKFLRSCTQPTMGITNAVKGHHNDWIIDNVFHVWGIVSKLPAESSSNNHNSGSIISTKPIQLFSIVSCSFLVWKISNKYYKWLTSPLRRVPHPKRTFGFWLGAFYDIFNEPFAAPQRRWWIEAQEKVNEENRKQSSKTTTDHDLLLSETGIDNTCSSNDDYIPFFAYSTMLGSYSLLVLDANIIQSILCDPSLAKDNLRYAKRYDLLKMLLGKGLVTLEGKDWSRHRRIIQPSFQMSLLEKKLDECVPVLAKTLVNCWKQIQPNTSIDVDTHLQALTLDIIGQAGFSYEFNSLDSITKWVSTAVPDSENPELNTVDFSTLSSKELNNKLKGIGSIDIDHPFIDALNKRLSQPSLLELILSSLKCVWLLTYLRPSVARNQRKLDEAADAVIATAKQTLITDDIDKSSAKPQGKSLLQLLLDATEDIASTNSNEKSTSSRKRNKLSLAELRDEAKTFLLAGHETTSTWCYWALYVLSHNNEVQDKVYENILSNSSSKSLDDPLTLEDVEKMDYLEAFLNEVLRYHPPVGLLFRFNTSLETLNGYTIPPNTRIIIPIQLLHRHPKYWGDDAETFRPERWLNTDTTARRHPYCFIPFSAGLRNCVGYKFARIEAKLIMANLIRELQFLPSSCMPSDGVTLSSKITIKSKPLVKITVKAR